VNTVRASAGLGATAALLAFGWLVARPADLPAPEPAPPAPVTHTSHAIGSAGCSGIACHGGSLSATLAQSSWGTQPADLDRWSSSDTVFRCYDKHAQAYEVLGNDLSRQIESRLHNPKPATEDVHCLSCHATPTFARNPTDRRLAEGVGCEACHGNAGTWIADHAGWLPGPDHDKRLTAAGMTHLADPMVRATTCAGCHIGAPEGDGVQVRDMNHDLIAAGHPRLNFDYGTYLRALPPHWAEKDRTVSPAKLRPASDEFTHWLTGRAAMAAAAKALRADRQNRGPWPELAEFDCYACHHNLTGESKKPLGNRPGALVPTHPLFGGKLDKLRSTTAEALARELATISPRRWDEACHLYYALVAIDRAVNPGKRADPELAKVRDALRLPRESAGAKYNSPLDVDPERLDFARLFRERAR
jgi:hypothetical protein